MYQSILYKGIIPIPVYAYTNWDEGNYKWSHILQYLLYTDTTWKVTLNDDSTERILIQTSPEGVETWNTKQVIVSGNKDRLVVDEFNMMTEPPTYMARIEYTTEPPNITVKWSRELVDIIEKGEHLLCFPNQDPT